MPLPITRLYQVPGGIIPGSILLLKNNDEAKKARA